MFGGSVGTAQRRGTQGALIVVQQVDQSGTGTRDCQRLVQQMGEQPIEIAFSGECRTDIDEVGDSRLEGAHRAGQFVDLEHP